MKKKTRTTLAVLFYLYSALLFTPVLYAQVTLPKEVVTEKSTVSFVKETPFNVALTALNEQVRNHPDYVFEW